MPVETSIIVGNLDGVHTGHVALLNAARQAAGPDGRVLVLAFDPHPLTVVRPAEAPPRLTTFEHRTELLVAAGADEVIRLEPAPDLLELGPDDFIAHIARAHQPTTIVEGSDFRFGRGRAGCVQTLRDLEAAYGYRTVVIDPVTVTMRDGSEVLTGSSLIRWLLERGRVEDAAAALGRPYELRGLVRRGDRRGRELGVPTANLDPSDCLFPGDGIYAGTATVPDGRVMPAAISVGTKPTFGPRPRTCEAHLIGYDEPLDTYDWPLQLRFRYWLRDQVRYRQVDALVDQLWRDIRRAEALVTARPRATLAGS
ncbi:MAG: bifunctional riboflavin kinase/FMN adenylyltransferase [Planctomycetota bacterium]|jgi:riboflavin kinase/FMN adenylyltransferase